MNNKLQEQLALIIEKAISLAEKTGEFIIEQGNELLIQFYYWKLTENILYIILAIIIFIIGKHIPYLWIPDKSCRGNSSRRYFKRWTKDSYDNYEQLLPAFIIFILSSIISVWMLFYNLFDLLKLVISPKLYIIEYFIN